MTASPAPKVEIYANSGWLTITSDTVAASVFIEHAASPGAIQAESDRLNCILIEDAGIYTEGNPLAPGYPDMGRGCPIRISAVITGTDVQRFYGRIDTMVADYPAPGSCRLSITAVGTLSEIGQGSDQLLSAMYRSMIGTTAGDYRPSAYWSLEDAAGSTRFASALTGGSAVYANVAGGVTLAADSSMAGSLPLPTMPGGTKLDFPVPAYTDSGVWSVQMALNHTTVDTVSTTSFRLTSGLSGTVTVTPATSLMTVSLYAADGALSFTTSDSITIEAAGHWVSLVIGFADAAGFHDEVLAVRLYDDQATVLAETSDTFLGVYAMIKSATVAAVTGTGTRLLAAGHMGVFADVAYPYDTGGTEGARAMAGWAGEQAHERAERLCREAGISCTILGTTSVVMGPQLRDTLGANLQDCADADHALLHDGGVDGAIVFICLDYLTNQAVTFTVPRDVVADGLRAIWDNKLTANDVTSSRTGGSSARVTDEAHIARTRKRIPRSPTPNVETDEQLIEDAGWTVWTGTQPGPRYDAIGLIGHGTAGVAVAAQLAALAVGNRIAVAASSLPTQHPPGGLDQLIVGSTETIDAVEWILAPRTVPYSAYLVGVLAEDTGDTDPFMGWLESDTCLLNAAVDDNDTSWQVNSTPLWSTDGDDFPCELVIGGEPITVTVVSGGSNPQTWTVTRSTTLAKDHGTDEQIELAHPIVPTLA